MTALVLEGETVVFLERRGALKGGIESRNCQNLLFVGCEGGGKGF